MAYGRGNNLPSLPSTSFRAEGDRNCRLLGRASQHPSLANLGLHPEFSQQQFRYDPFVPSSFHDDEKGFDSLSVVFDENAGGFRRRSRRELLRPIILDSGVAFRSATASFPVFWCLRLFGR